MGTLIGGVVGGASGFFGGQAKNNSIRHQNTQIQDAFADQNDYLRLKQINQTMANIAKHGGKLNTHGGTFTSDFTSFNNGGRHEQNPNRGIPQGVDPQGIPNLVEEGETK